MAEGATPLLNGVDEPKPFLLLYPIQSGRGEIRPAIRRDKNSRNEYPIR